MALVTTYTSCGPVLANDEWTEDFLAGISELEQGRGSHLSYREKQGLWLLHSTGSGGGVEHLEYSSEYSSEYE